MSLLVTLNGSNYIIPETNEVGWGSNLDDYFVAIAAGVLQKTGGSFTLSAETDFGVSYGLKSLYYKSRTSTPATAGQIRFARADVLSWRNQANGANLDLGVNSSNLLTFNGTSLQLSSLASAHIFVGNGSGVATDVAVTGDITIDNTGLVGISTGVIVNADVNASAAIAYSKLTLTGSIVNADVSASAAIAYSKLSLSNSILNADINSSAAIAYSKLNLATSIVNADINASAAIAYSKLNLATSILNADINASAAIAYSKLAALTASKALVSDGSGFVSVSAVTSTELGYVSGVTSAIQTQIAAKMPLAGGTFTDNVTFASGKGIFYTDSGTNTVKLTAPTTISATYTLKWPTAQGGANQYLTNDGSGNLSWTNAAGTGTVNSGTQYQLAYYATTTNVVSGLTLITASRALASDSNGLPVASATTATELGYVNGVTSAIQTQMNLKAPLASPTFTGTVVIPTPFTIGAVSMTATGTELNYVVGVTSAIQTQMNLKAPLASPQLSGNVGIGVGGAASYLLHLAGTANTNSATEMRLVNAGTGYSIIRTENTAGGAYGSLTVSGTGATGNYITGVAAADIAAFEFGGCTNAIINAVAPLYIQTENASSIFLRTNGTLAVTINSSQAATFAGAVTITGQATLNNASGNPIHGTNTNDSASAGYVGETTSSAVLSTSAPTTNQWGDLTSISLTAGDWLVSANAVLTVQNNNSEWDIGISTTSGNSGTGLSSGDNLSSVAQTTTLPFTAVNLSVPSYRVSLSSTTTVYFKYKALYTGTTPTASGRISAVRIR